MRPPDQVKRYADLFKRAALAIIDSGHIMVVQASDAVAQAIRTFFLKQWAFPGCTSSGQAPAPGPSSSGVGPGSVRERERARQPDMHEARNDQLFRPPSF
jgi:hypothetical protein